MTANKTMLAIAAMSLGMFGAASAADVSENFESGTVGESAANWTGGTVAVQVGAYAKTDIPGYAIAGNHTKMLAVEGTAVREYAESGDRVIDMMVMAEELPDEDLPTATGNEQIKLAFDTNGCINLYCTPAGGAAAAWKKISNTVYPSGTWVRVTCTLKYPGSTGKGLCQVKVDGSSVTSEFGYRASDNLVTPGAWYQTAIDCSTLAKIDFAGCGAVDDVVNAGSSYTPAVPAGAPTATNGIEYAWFDAKGLPWSDGSGAAPGSSGYTVKEAYDTGVDPYDSNKLYVSAATTASGNFSITFNGYGRTYTMEKSATPFTDGTAGTVVSDGEFVGNATANTTTWTGPLPTDALTYYRVRSDKATTAETVNQFVIQKYQALETNTLVALPWTALSPNVTSPEAMTAANVLMNVNLANGDWLLYYDGGYKGWTWNGSAWVATASSSVGGLTVTAAAGDATLERGRAIWYVRANAGDRTSDPFYLWGQYKAEKGSTAVAAGGALVASPDANNAFTVGTSKISSASDGDRIVVPAVNGTAKVFEKRSGTWGTDVKSTVSGPGGANMTKHTWTTSGDVMNVPAGKGFIYQNKAGSTPTINW